MPLNLAEVELLMEALAMAASRKESQARAIRHGAHHDKVAACMRELRTKFWIVKFGKDLERVSA